MGLLVLLGILILIIVLMVNSHNQEESVESTPGAVSSDTMPSVSYSAESPAIPITASPKVFSSEKAQVIKTVYRYNPSAYGAIMNGKWICRTCETENENKNICCLVCGANKGTNGIISR